MHPSRVCVYIEQHTTTNHSRRPSIPSDLTASIDFHRSWAPEFRYGDSNHTQDYYSHGCGSSHGCSLPHRWAVPASLYLIPLLFTAFRSVVRAREVLFDGDMGFAGTTAVKYGMCQTQCLEIQPNCDAWCKRIGYPKGGECIAPNYHNCCCWLVPPSSDEQLNGTAAGSFHNRTLHAWRLNLFVVG